MLPTNRKRSGFAYGFRDDESDPAIRLNVAQFFEHGPRLDTLPVLR